MVIAKTFRIYSFQTSAQQAVYKFISKRGITEAVVIRTNNASAFGVLVSTLVTYEAQYCSAKKAKVGERDNKTARAISDRRLPGECQNLADQVYLR